MRVIALTAAASFAAIALSSTPSLCLERVPQPAGATNLVTRVADANRTRSERPSRAYYRRHAWRLQERADGNRWVHFQYVNAGYPVRHYNREIYTTYFPGSFCCAFYGH